MTALAIADPREFARSRLARAKAGDQVAMAVLYDIGQIVRAGHVPDGHPILNGQRLSARGQKAVLKRLQSVYDAALKLRKEREAPPSFGGESPRRWWWPFGRKSLAPDFGAGAPDTRTRVLPPRGDVESRKPPVPAGFYDGLVGPTWREKCIEANEYRHGLAGAALVLADGPAIDAQWIEAAMSAMDASDALLFFEASQDPASRDPAARCVAMARWIQRVRDPHRPIGGMVGWELGE